MWRSADHIAPKGGSFEPARQSSFMILLERLGEDVELSVNSGNLPQNSLEVMTIPFMNESRKVAGKITVAETSLVIRDYIQPDTAQKVWDWFSQVADFQNGKIHYAATYKCDGEIITYDGEGQQHHSWKLVGCWPSAVDPGALDYSSSEQILITITLQIDKAWKL